MNTSRSAGGIVIDVDGRIALVSYHGTSWTFPKGHVEEGEDDEAAARRQIREETGLVDLTMIRELAEYKRSKIDEIGKEDISEMKTIVMFLFRCERAILRPKTDDYPEARWFAQDEVADTLTHERDKEFFLSVTDKLD
jgi:ADP-ribose pyrophosphatase YjhB (NUDIX family)